MNKKNYKYELRKGSFKAFDNSLGKHKYYINKMNIIYGPQNENIKIISKWNCKVYLVILKRRLKEILAIKINGIVIFNHNKTIR